ncbi:TPA: hypothetical protein EYP12_08695, partial [Candidatus Bipolaricaulota bacterium]|nr:hypothetical protein [Candidatus Bipolaricaulota bacterium]
MGERVKVPSDLEIAQAAKLKPIKEIAEEVGILEEELARAARGHILAMGNKHKSMPSALDQLKQIILSAFTVIILEFEVFTIHLPELLE